MKRREFIKGSAAATLFAGGCGTLGGGFDAEGHPEGAGRLNVAIIGCGTMGRDNMWGFLRDPRARVTVTCDPVRRTKAHGYSGDWEKKVWGGREELRDIADKFYGDKGCRAVADWREVVADPTVDAVCITTPDHWHAIIAIAAMNAGKHVYCQKPLALSITEGREMCKAAAANRVVFQVGSQQRSAAEFRQAAELVRNGYLGDCRTCTVGLSWPKNDYTALGFPRNTTPGKPPEWWGVNEAEWNMWQGPAEHWPDNAFIPGIHGPMTWRWGERTGGGGITDWGAHHIDILQWALGTELDGPVAIENFTSDIDKVSDRYYAWPSRFSFDIVYADGFRATVCDCDKNGGLSGLVFHSSKGDLSVCRGKITKPAHLASWKESDLLDSETRLHRSRGSHESDFIDGICDRNWKTACPCEIGHRSITIAHLANSCAKTGVKSLKWDAQKETSDNAVINARADVKRHNGWKLV
ncbi:MAG: Gfo/Idh/MocA family oxidoreductase [Kiritimatiellae bacterium]|nr:Gfo/Idh/MocA family oxidoreductase [Kiritimatiellia bacterium]